MPKKIDGNAPQLDGIAQQPAKKIAPPPETDPYLNRVAEECEACRRRVEGMISSMVHNFTLAQEIVAEATRRVYAHAKLHRDDKEIKNVAGTLYVTARHLVYDNTAKKPIADRLETVSFSDPAYETQANPSDKGASADETINRIAKHEIAALVDKVANDNEKALYQLLVQDKSTQEIADKLGVSVVTVRNWQANLTLKLRALIEAT